jgi:alpha-N-arabinofuranosidase
MDGIGPRDQRPPRLEMAWGTVESNRFGTHEFLDYIEKLQSEAYICANLGTGTWNEAQQWVEYCNSSADTEMTRLRKKNGRKDPWKVTYWGLGNEMDGPWQMGHRTADDYGKAATTHPYRLPASPIQSSQHTSTTPPEKQICRAPSCFTHGWSGATSTP